MNRSKIHKHHFPWVLVWKKIRAIYQLLNPESSGAGECSEKLKEGSVFLSHCCFGRIGNRIFDSSDSIVWECGTRKITKRMAIPLRALRSRIRRRNFIGEEKGDVSCHVPEYSLSCEQSVVCATLNSNSSLDESIEIFPCVWVLALFE